MDFYFAFICAQGYLLFMSQVNVCGHWSHPGLPCRVGTLSICPQFPFPFYARAVSNLEASIPIPPHLQKTDLPSSSESGRKTQNIRLLQLPDIKFMYFLVSGPNLSAIPGLVPHLFSGPHPPPFPRIPHCWTVRSLFPYKNNAMLGELHWYTLGCLFSFSVG